jgi:hypothetical protein
MFRGYHLATHTFAVLDVSKAAYEEIKKKLEAAGYQHTFIQDGERIVIDLNGIALAEEKSK